MHTTFRRSGLVVLAMLAACGTSANPDTGSSNPEVIPDRGAGDGKGGDAAGPAGSCGERSPAQRPSAGVYSGLEPHVTVAKHTYVGPAIVERSTADEMVLAYSSPGNTPELRHAQVSGLQPLPLPLLPPQAQVWLSVTDIWRNLEGLYPGSAIAVKVDEQGPLLFGFASGTTTRGLPQAKLVDHHSCTAHESPACPHDPNSYVTNMAAELQGDEVTVVDDGSTAIIELDGVAYDVAVSAAQDHPKCGVADYFPVDVAFTLRARNVQELTVGLARGAAPSCGVGNDSRPDIACYYRNGSSRASYDGPVVFQGPNSEGGPGSYLFHLAQSADGPTDEFGLLMGDGQLTLPAVGEEWWLSSIANDAAALFDARDGELQVATGEIALPLDEAHREALQSWLRVGVTAQKMCDYGGNTEGGRSSVWSLWELVMDTSPPVRARSGTLTSVQIGGAPYAIWVRSRAEDKMSFTILKQR